MYTKRSIFNALLGLLVLLGFAITPKTSYAKVCPPLQAEGTTFMKVYVGSLRNSDNTKLIMDDGSRVEAYTPTGKLAGCSAVDKPGFVSEIKLYGGPNGFAEGDVISLKLFDKDGVELPIAFNPIDIIWTGDNGQTNTAFQIKVVEKATTVFSVCAYIDRNFDQSQNPDEPCVTWNSSKYGAVFTFDDETGHAWTVIEPSPDGPLTAIAMSEIGEISILIIAFDDSTGESFNNTISTEIFPGENDVIYIPLTPKRENAWLFLPMMQRA